MDTVVLHPVLGAMAASAHSGENVEASGDVLAAAKVLSVHRFQDLRETPRSSTRAVQAHSPPQLQLADPPARLLRIAEHTSGMDRKSWQVNLPDRQAVSDFLQLLIDHKSTIKLDYIEWSAWADKGRSHTLTLHIALEPLYDDQLLTDKVRESILAKANAQFGVPRHPNVNPAGLDIPIDACVAGRVKPDAVRQVIETGVIDDAVVDAIASSRGSMPRYRPPEDFYPRAPVNDPDEEPPCNVASGPVRSDGHRASARV